MKLSATICSRNDNYGGNLIERSTFCLNSMVTTFDEVWYIDWNSDGQSLIYEIMPNLLKTGKLHHIQITPEAAQAMTKYDPDAAKCCDTIARNIGLSRSTGDWLVSTNIDIIAPKRETLENKIKTLDVNTFYTISRRSITIEELLPIGYTNIEQIKEFALTAHPEERHFVETVQMGDDYSIINCCGDFQMASNHIWNEIRGFEEHLIYPLYADTNIQKKSIMHGFKLKALYDIPVYHMHHPGVHAGGYGKFNKKANDPIRAITSAGKTENVITWGFTDIEMEYEII